jgi:hypothetical protein
VELGNEQPQPGFSILSPFYFLHTNVFNLQPSKSIIDPAPGANAPLAKH